LEKCDKNSFTSYELGRELLKETLTPALILLSNRFEQPPPLQISGQKIGELSSILSYTNDTLLVSCVPRRNGVVVLLSAQNLSFDTRMNGKNKPRMIFYNETKSDVDTVEMTALRFTVKCATRCWPLTVSFDIADMAAICAYALSTSLFSSS
jgi:hypothetical protein